MIRGIFFDLDDTLIGYAEAERSALEAGCALASRVNPSIDADALAGAIYDAYERRYTYGTPGYTALKTLSVQAFRRDLTEDALASFGIRDPGLTEALVDAYEEAEEGALVVFPDAVETLERLRPHFRIGLITNGPSTMQRAKLAALALDGYFDAIVVDTEFGHPKPDVRIFRHAAAQVDLRPGELLFVGNSLEADVAGSRAAGWVSVWMNPAGERPPSDCRPDYIISRLSNLLTLPVVYGSLALSETR